MNSETCAADTLATLKGLLPQIPGALKTSAQRSGEQALIDAVQQQSVLVGKLPLLLDAIVSMQGKLNSIRDDIERDITAIEAIGNVVAHASTPEQMTEAVHDVKDLNRFVDSLSRRLQVRWTEIWDETFAQSDRLANILKSIAELSNLGLELSGIINRARLQRNQFPGKVAADAVKQSQAEMLAGQANLSGADIQHEESKFLLQLAAGVATLDDVTPEVFAWIVAKRIQGRFHLSLR